MHGGVMSTSHRTSPAATAAAGRSRSQLVTCPSCGQQFPLTDALAEELASHVLAGKEPALREQIAHDLQAMYATDLQELQAKLHEQEQSLKYGSEEIKK